MVAVQLTGARFERWQVMTLAGFHFMSPGNRSLVGANSSCIVLHADVVACFGSWWEYRDPGASDPAIFQHSYNGESGMALGGHDAAFPPPHST